jgi:hypothetical protein
LASGARRNEKVTPVITPSVPSEPSIKWRRSGPAEARGPLPRVTTSPFGSTASI